MRSVKFVGREQKAANPYLLREVRFPDGERLPVLVCRVSGLPIELATYWVTSDLRGLNKQATTLRHDLENLMVAFLWADARGLDLPGAVKAPAFLTLSQMNDLDGFCRRPVSALVAEVQEKKSAIGPEPWQTARPEPGPEPDVLDPPIPHARQRRPPLAAHPEHA